MNPHSTRPLWQRFSLFLIPLMVSNILQALSGTFNSIFVGQMIGVEALASLAVFFPIQFFLISFIIGLSSGSTVLIGQAWGARNIARVKQVAGTTMTAAFVLGLVVAVLGGFWIDEIMGLLGAPEAIREMAVTYGRIMFFGMPGLFLFIVVTSILRGVGDTITPLFSLILSMVASIVLTPALIDGWWGLPRIGVAAAAWAVIAGVIVVLVFLFIYMRARRLPLAPDEALLAALRPDFPTLLLILRLGLPAGLQMVVASIAGIVVIGLVNRFGAQATAAYGALNQVLNYVQFPAMSIGIATSIFGAQAIGARHEDQLGAITRTALTMNLIITGLLVVVAYLFSQHLVGLFITDSEVIELTEYLLHIVLWAIVPFGWGMVFSGMMRASGMVYSPMIISLAAILLIELPGAVILSQTALGLAGIWIAYAASFTGMMLMQAAWYHFVWRRREIVALV